MCSGVMKRVLSGFAEHLVCTALCSEVYEMQISEGAAAVAPPDATASDGVPATASAERCRFPKLEECAHFHYEKVQLPALDVSLRTTASATTTQSYSHVRATSERYFTVQVTSGDECWLVRRSLENFRLFDAQLHRCIYDRKVSRLADLSEEETPGTRVRARSRSGTRSRTRSGGDSEGEEDLEDEAVCRRLDSYLRRFCAIVNNSLNCGPALNWLQMDNRGRRLLVPSEESRSINTPAVAAAYSVRRYVSQARDELDLEVGDMISVIDMAGPGESVWWRGKRGFKVGFFPQHCVHVIGEKVPRNVPLPPPLVGSLAVGPVIKPVLRKHGKLIAFFRSFILSRPSRRRLKQSGILRERVFGCDLGEHLSNTGRTVPTVLKSCAEFVETHGVVDGIYRLSGVTSNIQKLRNAFDEDRIPDLCTDEVLQDVHSVASLLKMYFRELPNPLCTYQLYQSFVDAVHGCDPSVRDSDIDRERLVKMREAVRKLPPPHYRTLEYLMRHLSRIAAHGNRTGMTTRNVAIVWAPNLLRSEELEGGGVAALQGVGVQAVVTEFLVCYADLIFSERLPNSDSNSSVLASPRRGRPKSLAISTPTKLITLEEARNKRFGKSDNCGYIDVGGGPRNLPEKYHTVIELPVGVLRTKSSPGWRWFFTRKTPPPIGSEKSKSISDSTSPSETKRKLRSVKSAESLVSESPPIAPETDALGPLRSLQKAPGHSRSVSHDSYFDLLQQPTTTAGISEGGNLTANDSLLDLSEIQLNFDLEESEMRIFSEDESLVSPAMSRRPVSVSATPKKQYHHRNHHHHSQEASSPEASATAGSRKRTRLEDQLSDIQFIDCSTPDNNNGSSVAVTTTAVVHRVPEDGKGDDDDDAFRRKSKSPRNSDGMPTPQSPGYAPLTDEDDDDGSNVSTPADGRNVIDDDPAELFYRQLKANFEEKSKSEIIYENVVSSILAKPTPPTYENVLTTISITYKSPTKRFVSPIYEDVVIPTPANQSQSSGPRPKSLSALEDLRNAASSENDDLGSTSCNFNSKSETFSLDDTIGDDTLRKTATTLDSSSVVSDISSSSSSNSNGEEANGIEVSFCPPTTPSFSPDVSQLGGSESKRKSSSDSENSVYQQVKYFRRSVHEINALVNVTTPQKDEIENPVYENVSIDVLDKIDVKSLRKAFEKPELPTTTITITNNNNNNNLKTRSLDESDFASSIAEEIPRRKSLDAENSEQAEKKDVGDLIEVKAARVSVDLGERKLNRERIERYKEERRKALNEMYRSESFRTAERDDDDDLLARLKLKAAQRGGKKGGVEATTGRKEAPPSAALCIKEVRAIFESKLQQ